MVLWFDVGLKRYTTHAKSGSYKAKLWFDVGLKRYTTSAVISDESILLWFDVGLKRYTTLCELPFCRSSCGLM